MRFFIWLAALIALDTPAWADEPPIKALCAMICGAWDEVGPVAPDQGSTRLAYTLAPGGNQIRGTEVTSGTFDGRPHPTTVVYAADPSTGALSIARTDESGQTLTGTVQLGSGGFQIAIDAADKQSRMLIATRFETSDVMVSRIEIVAPGLSTLGGETRYRRSGH